MYSREACTACVSSPISRKSCSFTFPVWLGWLFAAWNPRLAALGIALGLGVGALVGWSRLALGAHSESEVATAWLLGSLVSLAAVPALRNPVRSSRWPWLVVVLLALSVDGSLADYLPTRLWEVRIALHLSGRDKPYTRAELLRRDRPSLASKKNRPSGAASQGGFNYYGPATDRATPL